MLHTKALKPSHREKKRYIVYEVHTELDMPKVQKALVDKLTELLGVFMAAQAGILPVKFSHNRGIIRVNHTAVDYIKACFVMITELAGQPVQLKSVVVSGVLKKASEQLAQK